MTSKAWIVFLAIATTGLLIACSSADNGKGAREKKPAVSTEVGENLELPADFPTDIPVYSGMQIRSISKLPQGRVIQGQVQDNADMIAAFYSEQMVAAGWVEESPSGQPTGMRSLRFKKGQRVTSVNLMTLGGPITAVQLVLEKAG